MHSLSDKVLFRFYDSQISTSETGNLEVWVAVMLAFSNLGEDKSKNPPRERKAVLVGSLEHKLIVKSQILRGFTPSHPFYSLIG